MTRIQRRIFERGAVVGVLLTLIVIAADLAGALGEPEHWLYDLRARFFQFYSPKPTDLLVHVDIDDRSMESIGAWPWPRARLAAMLNEMRRAGVKAIALDILFSEPQPEQPDMRVSEDGTRQFAGIIDNDAQFVAAIARLNNVVVPGSLGLEEPRVSDGYRAMLVALEDNPELDQSELVQKLGADHQKDIANGFLSARRAALFLRIDRAMKAGTAINNLKSAVIPSAGPGVASPLARAFEEELARWESIAAMTRTGGEFSAAATRAAQTSARVVPFPALARAAAGSAFVDFTTHRDGVLRSVPLLAELDGKLIPHLGFSLALQTLGVRVNDLQFDDSTIVIPTPDGRKIAVPVSREYLREQKREVGLMLDLPWFGSRDWETMYDWPAHRQVRQHLSMDFIWGICSTLQKIRANNQILADGLRKLSANFGARAPTSQQAESDDPHALIPDVTAVLTTNADFVQAFRAMRPEEIDEQGKAFLYWIAVLQRVRDENASLASQLEVDRKRLLDELGGRAVLIGYTATGMLDVTRTSLHARCPGVVSHGVVFNSIMAGEFWRRGPHWMTLLATAILGLLAAAIASWLSPTLALAVTFLLGAGYIVLNGLVLFDRGNMLVGLAGPLGALAVVWAGCTVMRMIVEASERARITRRFRSYVDPTLVTHVLENPDLVRLEGETRELTVVFTDLAGFTSISEKLGHETVPLLNDYMGRMVPIIRAQKGYVNKFLGDGIMFFFGAPIANSSHAAQAVEAVLEMQPAVEKFNEELAAKGLPAIGMRAGISSGMMVVGDAGSAEASDYTVLGDTVNLGARLESANKAAGTKVLMNARTAELLDGRFLIRPIGRLQVVGKAEGVMTFEAMAMLSDATDLQKRLAQRTKELVDAFIAKKFDECRAIADSMDAEFGPSDLTELYREECDEYLKNPPPPDFDGRIKLTEK